MGIADMELSDEETKYFESRGRSESNGEEREQSSGQALQTTESDTREPEPSVDADGTDAEENGTEKERGLHTDSDEKAEGRPDDVKELPRRDFEKAYGIAENKRLELKRQLESQSQQNETIKKQLDSLVSQAQPQQAQPKVTIPDKEEDPMGYYSHQVSELNKTVNQQQDYLQKQAQQHQQSQQVNAFISEYKRSAEEYTQTQTDFLDAYRYLEKSRLDEYAAAGYKPQEAVALLQEDEMAIAARAFQAGVNPAERIYAAAKSRGYSIQLESPSKLENVEKGLKVSKSLSSSKAKNINRALDVSAIDSMSDTEFDNYFSKVKSEHKREGNFHKGI